MSTGRAVLLIIVASTLLRLALAASSGLGVDESYMVGNARILSLSYVDHPPLHVWIAGLAMRLFGSEGALAVRLPFVLLFAGSMWLLFLLTRRLFGALAGICALVAFNLLPVFSVADGMWVLPDGPLIFFLLAGAVAAERALFGQDQRTATLWWIAAGVLGGLALLSKYSALFFFAAMLLHLLTTRSARRQLAAPGPWIGVLAAAILFLPVVVWNAQNEMAGLGFQSGRFAGLPPFSAGQFFGSIGGQVAYLTPWLFVPLVYALYRALKAGPRESRGWFVALQAALPVGAFTLLSGLVSSLPHWPMPGWLFALPLLGREAARLMETRPRLVLATGVASALLFGALLAAFTLQSLTGAIAKAVPTDQAPLDPTLLLIDWTDLRDTLSARGLLRDDTVLGAGEWITASKVSYAVGPHVPVICVCVNPHHFPFRANPRDFSGRDVVVVVPRYDKRAIARVEPYFDTVTPLDPVTIHRAGEPVLEFELLLGHHLRPEPPN